jgi:hypothetical protein
VTTGRFSSAEYMSPGTRMPLTHTLRLRVSSWMGVVTSVCGLSFSKTKSNREGIDKRRVRVIFLEVEVWE